MIWPLMHIVSDGNNLHEISNPVFWEKQEIANKQHSLDIHC